MTHQRTVLITLGVMMSLFMASMESTVIATAMPSIVRDLGDITGFSWVFAIYMLTSTTAGPIFGRLSDLFGRRPIYLTAIAIFSLGSLWCGLAATMPQLIMARALQGLGAGGLLPLAFIIVGDIFTLEQRAKVQGLFSGVWGVSSVIGPLIGGFLVDQISWHWVFWINLPPAAIAAALVWMAWRDPVRVAGTRPPIDYAGAALLSVGVVLLLLGLNEPTSLRGIALLSAAAATLALLVMVELRAPAPILPVRLLRERMFAVACLHGILAGGVLFGSMNYVPLFAQGVLGASATAAGTTLTPMMLGWVFTSIIGGRLLLRFSYRSLVIWGMIIFVVGALMMARLRPEMSQPELAAALGLMGIGMGASIPSFLIAVQSTVARSVLGAATASLQFARTIGGTIGVAALGTLLTNRLATELAMRGLQPDAIPVDALLGEGATTVVLAGEPRLALAAALAAVFTAPLIFALAALAVTFFAPAHSPDDLRRKREYADSMAAAPQQAGAD
ncbi:MAG: MFS transporter [Chloroflexus sp.]|uniref:MDR family MFS transporter n=1 Tax=Chloroflexus sp. TaxID=1904827 RepID=UPI0021DD3771|nr:MDR family MFS transporter [Chloroflexus sp.]GIV89458.1 MAG: MFS transporter [Chloroflexus sp.]